MSTRDVVLVLDHFRPERHAVTQLYNKHFLGVVYIVDATGWPGYGDGRRSSAKSSSSIFDFVLDCFGSSTS